MKLRLQAAIVGLFALFPVAAWATNNGCQVSTTFNTNGSNTAAMGTNTGNSLLAPCPVLQSYLGGALDTAPGTGNTSAALPVQGVASGIAIPVSAASLPLPSGAATGALQSGVQTPITPATATATNAQLLGMQYNSTQATFTNGQQGSIQGSARGALYVTNGVDALTVQPGNTANTTAWLVTGTGGTFPVSQATAANLNATVVGTGTFAVQSNPGTAANWGVGSIGSAAPASAVYQGAVSSGNLTGLIQADASAAINVSTATTTQLVALSSGKKIYVTSFDVIAGGTGNITFEYGTGSTCATGTTILTGAYNLTAQNGIAKGNGLGPVLVVPSGDALCVLTTAAVQMSGSVAYTQF